LRRCLDTHGVIAIRVYPNYHDYRLDDPMFGRLLQVSSDAGRPVQIAAAMEDTRTQHPLVRVEDVDLRPLPELLRRVPGAKVQILNLRPRGRTLEPLVAAPRVHFDVARMDSTRGIAQLIDRVGADRVCYGSGAPLLIPEAAAIRVSESRLNETQLHRVSSANAQALVAA
jgi:predicted TIM-barrel fold metal-dependent hydrolase